MTLGIELKLEEVLVSAAVSHGHVQDLGLLLDSALRAQPVVDVVKRLHCHVDLVNYSQHGHRLV